MNVRGDLCFTQLPTPGLPGDMRGSNTVSKLDATTCMIVNITFSEPEPTFIDVTRQREIYRTCKSAGVILRHVACETMLVINMLLTNPASPSRIAARTTEPCTSPNCPLPACRATRVVRTRSR